MVTSFYGGISQGIQPLISQSYAKKDNQHTYAYLRYAFITSFIISLVIYMIIIFFSDNIVLLFNSENNDIMATIAKNGLFIYFFGFFFAGINMIIISYFAAIENMKPSFLLSLLRGGLVIIPFVIVFAQFFSMNGVWLSFPLSELFIMLLAIVFQYREVKSYDSNQ